MLFSGLYNVCFSHSECSKSNLGHPDFQNFSGGICPQALLASTHVIRATSAFNPHEL